MEIKGRRALARVAVDRTLKLIEHEAVPMNAKSASSKDDGKFHCASCGAALCDGSRLKLFAGMDLTCTRCGATNRIPRRAFV
ncbi:MAG TPA: hypothetical protein VMK12_20785 [Anaeromyxobacteraceae bacterium]|nr:hypothetical protein [Anaeromyxobacteraceae bacterium]